MINVPCFSPFLFIMQIFFHASGALPWCCTWKHWYSKSNNRICCPCCNRDFGSRHPVTEWIYEVFLHPLSPILTWKLYWHTLNQNINSGNLPSAKKQEAQAVSNKRETRFYLNDRLMVHHLVLWFWFFPKWILVYAFSGVIFFNGFEILISKP
jgi:hypothetical protein